MYVCYMLCVIWFRVTKSVIINKGKATGKEITILTSFKLSTTIKLWSINHIYDFRKVAYLPFA